MAGEIHFDCDRCGAQVEGYVHGAFTSGFYVVGSGAWHEYANEGEERICDSCMWHDPEYEKVYGIHR